MARDCILTRKRVSHLLCIVIGNQFGLWRWKQREAFGHERIKRILMGANVVRDVLYGAMERRKGGMIAIAGDLAFQVLPESLNQVQIRRIGRQ